MINKGKIIMSILKIGGQIFGVDTKPITNAKIKIIDTDMGSSSDVIFRGTTDSEGKFRGDSSNWEDNNWINGPFNTRVPMPDILSLEFDVEKAGKTHKGPYLHMNNYRSAPIICPWSNPDTLFAKVNDVFCYSAESTKAEMSRLLDNNDSITLHIFDPAVRAAYAPLTGSRNAQAAFISSAIGIDDAVVLAAGASALLILLGIAAVIVAVGYVEGVKASGEAMLLAVDKGCNNTTFENSTGVDNTGSNQTTTKVEFDCSNI